LKLAGRKTRAVIASRGCKSVSVEVRASGDGGRSARLRARTPNRC
jgi:hypothetical protein